MAGDPSRRRSGHDPYAALRYPAFARFLSGSCLVWLGTSAQSLAIGWEVYTRTGEAFSLGIVGLVQAIPMFLLTLPAGYLADVFDRRKLMLVSMLGTSITSLMLAWFSYRRGSIDAMYVLLFLDSAFLRLGWPARSAIMPLLVPASHFESAVKWRTTLLQVSSMAGPALGGFIVGWSVPAAYLFSATCTLAFMGLLFTIEVPPATRSRRGGMFGQVREGLQFVWRKKDVLGSISLDLFAVLFGGAVYLLPIFARDILVSRPLGMTPEQTLGWLRAAPAAGAMVMAVIMAHRPPMRGAGRTLFRCVAGFGAATVVFGLSKNFWLSFIMLFMTGFFDNVSMIIRHTLVQMSTPNHMRGRVSAVNAIFIGSSNQLGGFESGLVAQLFSPVISVVSGGLCTLLVTGTWALLFPGLRHMKKLVTEESEE